MSKPFLPMLAPSKTPTEFFFPLLVSPKIDGIRAMVINGVVTSRSLKPIPNRYVQSLYGKPEYEGFDGELAVGVPYDLPGDKLMQRTMKGVMSEDGEPNVHYYVFDMCNEPTLTYLMRNSAVRDRFFSVGPKLSHLQQKIVRNQEELDAFEAECLETGYEGAMGRSLEGKYKHGRCTLKEWNVVKIKRFHDAEATVIGVEEMMHNDNEATTNELGRTKRSSHKAGKRPAGVMGKLVCLTPEGVEFKIGTGFSAKQRAEIYLQHLAVQALRMHPDVEPIVGKLVTYKSLHAGVKIAPRSPVFKAFRHPDDL